MNLGAAYGSATVGKGLVFFLNSQIHKLYLFIFRCPPEFVYLYREFGGSLWIRDSRQRLATEISDRAPALALMKQLQGKIVDCLFLLYSLSGPVEAI